MVDLEELWKCFFFGWEFNIMPTLQTALWDLQAKMQGGKHMYESPCYPSKIAQALAKSERESSQTMLDVIVINQPNNTFMQDGILHAVAQFITCDDQVSEWCHSIQNMVLTCGNLRLLLLQVTNCSRTALCRWGQKQGGGGTKIKDYRSYFFFLQVRDPPPHPHLPYMVCSTHMFLFFFIRR